MWEMIKEKGGRDETVTVFSLGLMKHQRQNVYVLTKSLDLHCLLS